MASLFVFQGNDQGARFELEADELSLGRDVSNGIQLHDTEVSRKHAEIRRRGRTFAIVDLASSNGVFVNGEQVESRDLATGDEVRLGRTLLLFTGHGEDSTSDLADKVDIVQRPDVEDRSRIVHSVKQVDGGRPLAEDLGDSSTPWLARARGNLQVMYRTALAVSHTLDIDQLLERIMQLIFEWVEADRGCIMLLDAAGSRLTPKVRRDRKGHRGEERITISRTILDYVMEHNEGVLTSDARQDDRWDGAASILQMGIREAICVPMRGRYSMVGVIYIDTSTSGGRWVQQGGLDSGAADRSGADKFTEEHLKLMVAIAHQAALAIEDTRHYSAMVQAERLAAVGQTIAALSHDVKNILQGIRGASWLIKEGLSRHDEAMIAKGWGFVEKHQERISNMVLDMLTFSKEREPDRAPANMNEVTREVIELMRSRAEEKGVELAFLPAPNLPLLVFDAEGMTRAILNIVTNALDACDGDDAEEDAIPLSPGKVRVEVEFDAGSKQLRVIVTDNGAGIPADRLDDIFSLFVSHKGSRGTGLGLAVSQKIVQEHGGRIHVRSQPGLGSRFSIEIPACPDSPLAIDVVTLTGEGKVSADG